MIIALLLYTVPALGQQPAEPQQGQQREESRAADTNQGANDATPEPPIVPPADTQSVADLSPEEGEQEQSQTEPDEAEDNSDQRWGWFLFRDTIAQWLMMISGVAAVAISAIAVWLLKHTLKATQDAVARADDTIKTMAMSERAFVRLSHAPPGLTKPVSSPTTFEVKMQVINSGRTPATITDVFFRLALFPKDDALPDVPIYGDIPKTWARSGAFLHAGSKFTRHERLKVPSGKGAVVLFGYVDYTDVFGKHHRGGYARLYKPEMEIKPPKERNNLVFVAKRGWNYDRERDPGEGSDE